MVPQDSIRFNFPLKRIDLTTSSPFLDALTLISLQLSFTDSDLTAESAGVSGAQVLQVAVLKSVPLPSELAYRIAAEKHRADIDLLSPIVLDLGPFSFAEQEARRTTCSNLGPQQNPTSCASESHSRLWCQLLNSAIWSSQITDQNYSLSCAFNFYRTISWLSCGDSNSCRVLEQGSNALQS